MWFASCTRSTIAAALACAALATPAVAQGHRGKREMPDSQTVERRAKNAEIEKEYKAALDKIPDQKQPTDPWGNVRSAEPVKVKAGNTARPAPR